MSQAKQALALELSNLVELRDLDQVAGDVPRIAEPIDKGAVGLLRPHQLAALQYPPLALGYLLSSLNEHLQNCLDIRNKAQDLEELAFARVMELALESALLSEASSQVDLAKKFEPRLLGNLVDAQLQNGQVQGGDSTYWSDAARSQQNQIDLRRKYIADRTAMLQDAGSGMDYAGRFLFLKKLFSVDLLEAFLRARAISAGLQHVYGMAMPVPDLRDTGYLDLLVLWARDVTYALEKRLLARRSEATIAIALNAGSQPTAAGVSAPLTQAAFNASLAAGRIAFTLSAAAFARAAAPIGTGNPRLLGVDGYVIHSHQKPTWIEYWRMRVDLPRQDVKDGLGNVVYASSPRVFVPLATFPEVAGLGPLSVMPEVTNCSPLGDWVINIDATGVDGVPAVGHVTNILLRFLLTYEV